jgi:hypothetical protein
LHLVNLKPSPACICGHGFEDCIHFFFKCPFYNEKKVILFNKLENCVVTIELIFNTVELRRRRLSNKQNNIDWSEYDSTLKALGASNKRINSNPICNCYANKIC